MRYSRLFRWVVRGFLLVLTLSLSSVSFLGGYSAMTILDPEVHNIKIPDGAITQNFNITNPGGMYINIPYNISNSGVYDLTNISLSFQVALTYGDASKPLNDTTTVIIFYKEEFIGTVVHGGSLKSNLVGTASDGFIIANIPDPSTEVDWTRAPYALEFYISLTFSAYYSLDLYKFTVNIRNLPAGHVP